MACTYPFIKLITPCHCIVLLRIEMIDQTLQKRQKDLCSVVVEVPRISLAAVEVDDGSDDTSLAIRVEFISHPLGQVLESERLVGRQLSSGSSRRFLRHGADRLNGIIFDKCDKLSKSELHVGVPAYPFSPVVPPQTFSQTGLRVWSSAPALE